MTRIRLGRRGFILAGGLAVSTRGASAQPAPPEVLTGAGVNDLMAALQASVEQARRASKGRSKPAVRRKRKTA